MNFSPTGKVLVSAGVLVLTALAAWHFHWEDVHTYYDAARSLVNGRADLYAADFADSRLMDYRYPPFFLFLFVPFAFLPYYAVKLCWFWLNIAACFLTAKAVARGLEITTQNRSRIWLALGLSFAVSAKYFFMLFYNFNAHLLIIGLMFGAFYLLIVKRSLAAAALMALAVTFKITPILTLPYFVLKKQWKFLAANLLFIAVFNLLPALYFGTSQNTALLYDWYDHVMIHNEFHETNGPINLSLKGQITRILTDIDYSERSEDKEYATVNIASLNKKTADLVWKISGAIIFIVTFALIWFCGRLRNRGRDFAEFDSLAYFEFGMVICLMLIVAPRTNGYYLTALFFPLVPLVQSLLRKSSTFNLIALGLVTLPTIFLPLYPGRLPQRYLLVSGVDFYGVTVLWFALGYNLLTESRRVLTENEPHSEIKLSESNAGCELS